MEPSASTAARATRCRWAAVGRRADGGARSAAAGAVADAVAGRPDARLVLVFAGAHHDAGAVARGATGAAGDAVVVGCTAQATIAAGGTGDDVVALALGGEGFDVSATAVRMDDSSLRDAGAAAAACLGDVAERPHRLLLLLTDGGTAAQQELVRGAYSVGGAGIPIVGGAAGSTAGHEGIHQFLATDVLSRGVVGVALGSDAPFGVGVGHGFGPIGEPLLVTRSTGTEVLEIDDRPAAEVYLDRLGVSAELRRDPEALRDISARHPLGLVRRTGDALPRVVFVDGDQLHCGAGIPQGSLVWLLEGDATGMVEAAGRACDDAVHAIGGEPAQALLLFDCGARRHALGAGGVEAEQARILAHSGGAAVAGFYTFGEIARTHGVVGFHTHTLVALAVA